MLSSVVRISVIKVIQIIGAAVVMLLWTNLLTLIFGVFSIMFALANWFERLQAIAETRDQLRRDLSLSTMLWRK